jgi:hypothetical protein
MHSRDEVAEAASAGYWWVNLETGAAFQAKETTGPMVRLREGEWQLLQRADNAGPGPGIPRVICYGSLEELRDMVRRWLGDDLYIEESLLEVATPEPEVRRSPLASPWAFPLPKTVAEARSLGQRPAVGVEIPTSDEAFLPYLVGVWVLCTVDEVIQNSDIEELGQLGLVIDADGRWAALLETDGELSRSAGWTSEGTWDAFEQRGPTHTGNLQLNLTLDGGGRMSFMTTFATSPPLMHLHGTGVLNRMGVHVAAGSADVRTLKYVKLDRSLPRQSE